MAFIQINPALLLPVLFLSLPFYFLSKFMERKIQPRKSGRRFLLWFVLIIAAAAAYFLLVGAVYSWYTRT